MSRLRNATDAPRKSSCHIPLACTHTALDREFSDVTTLPPKLAMLLVHLQPLRTCFNVSCNIHAKFNVCCCTSFCIYSVCFVGV